MVLLGKLNHAAFLVTFQLANPKLLRLLTQASNIQQIACRSVMIDGSHFPFEENIALVKSVVDLSHRF
jgi:fructose/tagatose bisphosphate aldolase